MPTPDGTVGRGTTTTWSTGVGTEGHDQGSSLHERGRTGKNTLGNRKDDQEPAGAQGTTATDSSIREPHERTLDQDHEGRPHAAANPEGLGLPGFRQARSQDISRSPEDGSRILPLDRSGGRSAIPLKTQEILIVAEDAEPIPGTEPGKQHDSRTCDKPHQTTGGGKAIRGNASIERPRQEAQDARTEGSQLNHSIGGGKPLVKGTSPEVDGTCSVTDDVSARAWGGEFGRELCGMAETHGETAMSTLSSDEMSSVEKHVTRSTAGSAWDYLTERPRLVLTERVHTQEQGDV